MLLAISPHEDDDTQSSGVARLDALIGRWCGLHPAVTGPQYRSIARRINSTENASCSQPLPPPCEPTGCVVGSALTAGGCG